MLKRLYDKPLPFAYLAMFVRHDWPEGFAQVWIDRDNADWVELRNQKVMGRVVRNGRPTSYQPTRFHQIVAARLGADRFMVCPTEIDGLQG